MEDLHIPVKKKLETRSNTRNHVFNLVFQLEFFEPSHIKDILDKYYEILDTEEQIEKLENENFIPLKINKSIIEKQLYGLINNLSNIDEKIKECSKGWEISRIDKVDLAILRLAIYEMLFDDVPTKVAINEAIELSKEYSSEKSYRFINAVLGKV
ncbi:transcription antitermination factor NusB [uncultured Tyzzerella sp.]|uniref:transcription antitermination factor NusB n=1 Tax=uncultured Tyzzerella sp. TaxID=2321398 RepID=UPI002942504D|nr:transcription antitermination factor NusB [uncultured Tyzzerella sp.]